VDALVIGGGKPPAVFGVLARRERMGFVWLSLTHAVLARIKSDHKLSLWFMLSWSEQGVITSFLGLMLS
jgi:hypothetical protein